MSLPIVHPFLLSCNEVIFRNREKPLMLISKTVFTNEYNITIGDEMPPDRVLPVLKAMIERLEGGKPLIDLNAN